MERVLARRSNTFRLETEAENRFLRVDSRNSASALWRRVDVTGELILSWRWRVSTSLGHIDDVRRRRSDDYAARVAVMFDGTPFARTTPLLMYVWAGNESVGNVYPSPYSDQAATIVLRSGDVDSGDVKVAVVVAGIGFEDVSDREIAFEFPPRCRLCGRRSRWLEIEGW